MNCLVFKFCFGNDFCLTSQIPKIIFATVLITIALGFAFLVPSLIQRLNCYSNPASHYWSGENAPDGRYEVLFCGADYQTNMVWFPLCPSSGSKLHGDWLFASGVVFPLEDRWIVVVLEGNVIVEAEWGIR